jgi:hypothetical protein
VAAADRAQAGSQRLHDQAKIRGGMSAAALRNEAGAKAVALRTRGKVCLHDYRGFHD